MLDQRVHVSCLICGSRQLQPLLNLSEEGMSHSAAGHNFTYAYQIITVCGACGHGQLEKYSHDCFHYYGDEDWEMYWWSCARFERGAPPARYCLRRIARIDLNAACAMCALHRSLRESAARLWGGVTHAIESGCANQSLPGCCSKNSGAGGTESGSTNGVCGQATLTVQVTYVDCSPQHNRPKSHVTSGGLLITHHSHSLLVPQRLNRIHARGALRGIHAREQPHERRDAHRQQHRHQRDAGLELLR